MASTSTVLHSNVLGKRKQSYDADSLVLHLVPSPELSAALSDSDLEHSHVNTSSGPPILVNGKIVSFTKKRYQCTHNDCDKAYTKPSRLAEHERSHSGHRPFVCETCRKSYLRESHLQAHLRSHLPASSRPLACSETNCEKRFWTSQHLRVHLDWHNGVKSFQCPELHCGELFAKNHQFRTHMCSIHAPPGTKPFQCDYLGCPKSFATNQQLRTHAKVHDEKRYTCIHKNCLASTSGSTTYFSTWTALQHHLRSTHPPTCPHPSCNNRTFSSQKGLRAHQKLHEQREVEAELDAANDGSDRDDDEPQELPRKKRRGGEVGRDWNCDTNGCGKGFKSKQALTKHINITHLGRRDYVCPRQTCPRAFGYKHLLQRHLAKAHLFPTSGSESSTDSGLSDRDDRMPEIDPLQDSKSTVSMNIDTMTGKTYGGRVASDKALCCPYPHLENLNQESSADFDTQHRKQASRDSLEDEARCAYVFHRAYDLRRHLRATHGIQVKKESLDEWVRELKRSA